MMHQLQAKPQKPINKQIITQYAFSSEKQYLGLRLTLFKLA